MAISRLFRLSSQNQTSKPITTSNASEDMGSIVMQFACMNSALQFRYLQDRDSISRLIEGL